MGLSLNKIGRFFLLLLILTFSLFLASRAYLWLMSINANLTLRISIPTVVFISSALGLWVISRYLKIFIFQKRGVKGYQLRGRITFYLLLISICSIVVVGGLMYYLILLIEQSFIKEERNISEGLLNNYRQIVDIEKNKFETLTRSYIETNEGFFPVIFYISNETVIFERKKSQELASKVLDAEQLIKGYYIRYPLEERISEMFYLGENQKIAILYNEGRYYVQPVPDYLSRPFKILKKSIDQFNELSRYRQLIQSVPVYAIIIFSVPILIAVFFVSLTIAKSITQNIEEIAKGTRIIAEGNLDYRVDIKTRDEIGYLAVNFNMMAQKLKQATDQIKRMERLEAWQEMAKRLAHEIKNPLTPIKLSAERMLHAYETGKKDFEAILQKTTSIIISETLRLENLVNEFSKFARLPYLNLVRQNIIKTINEILQFFQSAYPDLRLIREIPMSELMIYYDENQLKQVIINIITNAIEACKKKEKYVKIGVETTDSTFLLSIKDKSGGIPLDIQNKIFEPYFTTKAEGTGLGLAIAERIIIEHNGDLWFKTNKEGTVFYIQLPLQNGGTGIEK